MEGIRRHMVPNRPHWNYQRPPPPHFNQWRSRPPPPLMGPRPFRPSLFLRPIRPVMSPQNQEYWCESCDKVFPAKNLLDKHLLQHQKCNIDGCQFVAHPKIITKHIQMQHSTGLYKKIAGLNNPEDIKKWREERRKKYPTKANIEKKLAAVNEKIERGEKMGLGQNVNRRNHDKRTFTPGHKRHNITNENQPRSKNSKFNKNTALNKNPPQNKKTQEKKAFTKIVPQLETRKLKPFAGIQSIVENDDISEDLADVNDFIEDVDNDVTQETVSDEKEPAVCSALSSLLCNYGSSDEDVDENPNCEPNPDSKNDVIKEKNNKIPNNPSNVKKSANNESSPPVKKELIGEPHNARQDCEVDGDEFDGDSGPEEVKVEKTLEMPVNNELENKAPKKDKSYIKKKTETVRIHNFKKTRPKLPSTLLQKLLSREMEQERNIILQCIRFIKKHNYFYKQNVST